MTTIAPCAEAWFEPMQAALQGQSSLRVVFAKPVKGELIHLALLVGRTKLVFRFEQIAVVKGLQVFEATGLYPESKAPPLAQDLLFQPSGPFQDAHSSSFVSSCQTTAGVAR